MNDLLGLGTTDTSITSYFSFLVWSSVASLAVIAVYFVIKTIIKNNAKKKEKEEMEKFIGETFEKYSDIIADKIVNKLNNKQQ